MGPTNPTAIQRKKMLLRQKLRPDRSGSVPAVAQCRSGVQAAISKKKPQSAVERLKHRALQLDGSKFRFLNEALYTTSSGKSQKLFQGNPENFRIYHEGFRSQVKKWPQNPVDYFIANIRGLSSALVVADFGCGEAKIAESVPNLVHSFDLVAVNDRVTACDIANVPLKKSTVDIAIFCLSLMGINWPEFIREANRVLKQNGMLKIAEVRSRIGDIQAFIEAIKSLGFQYDSVDDSNVMFLRFEFTKLRLSPKKLAFDSRTVLKPCLYKKR